MSPERSPLKRCQAVARIDQTSEYRQFQEREYVRKINALSKEVLEVEERLESLKYELNEMIYDYMGRGQYLSESQPRLWEKLFDDLKNDQ